jgi:UTP--glucose-1-phosphate uridylyltransferase
VCVQLPGHVLSGVQHALSAGSNSMPCRFDGAFPCMHASGVHLARGCRCPPGHGDIYPSLLGSGMMESLLAEGIKYVFVSNSDNLGATLDLKLLNHFATSGQPFCMEVAERTESDKKGGHLCKRKVDGAPLQCQSLRQQCMQAQSTVTPTWWIAWCKRAAGSRGCGAVQGRSWAW